jgi:hypothetical protein
MTNTFDAANRLVETQRDGVTLEPVYNGGGDRVGQTIGTTTTHFALDIMGLPEVIQADYLGRLQGQQDQSGGVRNEFSGLI